MTAEAREDPLVGAYIGNYLVRQKLGRGGMGAVYLAEHPIIGKRVAVKVLHPELAIKQEIVTRFFSEGRTINEIQHPNIVDIVDFGTLENDGDGQKTAYLVMEYLDGRSLRDLLREEAPLHPARAADFALQIASALAASHRKGIVHRDLKPENVMIVPGETRAERVVLLDFGVAKLLGDGAGENVTQTGAIIGTPRYMSPEQCEGKGEVDHRTDIYSLGVLLYAMLTRRVPFTGTGFGELAVKHLTVPPDPPRAHQPDIPPAMEAVCLRALEKAKDARFQRMEELASALPSAVSEPVTQPADASPAGAATGGPAIHASLRGESPAGGPAARPSPAASEHDDSLPSPPPATPRPAAPEHDDPLPSPPPATPSPAASISASGDAPPGLAGPDAGTRAETDDGPAELSGLESNAESSRPPISTPAQARPGAAWLRYALWAGSAAVAAAVGLWTIPAVLGGEDAHQDRQGEAGAEPTPSAPAGGEDLEAGGEAGDVIAGSVTGADEEAEGGSDDSEGGGDADGASAVREEVEIAIRSTPAARATIAGEREGETPLTVTRPASESAVEIRLEAEGHEDLVETIVADRDRDLDLTLERASPPRAGPARRPSREPTREAPRARDSDPSGGAEEARGEDDGDEGESGDTDEPTTLDPFEGLD